MKLFSGATRFPFFRKNAPYLPLLAFIVIAILFAVTSFQSFRKIEGLIVEDKLQDLGAIADMKVAQIVGWRKRLIRHGETFPKASIVPDQFDRWQTDGMPADGRRKILLALNGMKYVHGYKDITLFDQQGRARISTMEHGAAQDADDVALAAEAIRTGKVIISDIHHSGPTGQHIRIDLVTPLVIAEGESSRGVGALVFEIDPEEFLYPLMRRWPTSSPSAETTLSRREGDDVLFLNELRHKQGTALSFHLPLSTPNLPAAMAVLGKTSSLDGVDYRGAHVVSVMRPVPGTPWFMVSKLDKAELLGPLARLQEWSLTLGLAFAVIGGMLTFFWLRAGKLRYRHLKAQHDAVVEREMLVRHFELLTRYANDIILVADEEMRIVEANERAVEAFGYTRDELLNMRAADFRDPSQALSSFNERFSELMATGELRVEDTVRRKDGSIFPVEISARVIEVQGRRYLQGILRDISERRRVELALRKSEALLNESQQTAHIGSWELDLVANVLTWSEENYRIFEVDRTRFGASYEAFLAAIHPDDLAMVNQAYTDSVKNRTPYRIVHRLQFAGQRIKYVEEWCETFYDEEGKPIRSVGTTQDVTERHQFEETLARKQDFVRQVVDSVPNLIFVKDAQGRFLLVNQAMAALHHTTTEELIGRDPAELFQSREEYEIHAKADREVLATRRKVVFVAHNVLGGKDKWLLVTKAPMEQPDGTVNILGVVEDITEKHQADDLLRKSSEEIEDLYENAPCGYHSLDGNGVFVRVNNTELQWLGYTRDELIGKVRISDLYTPRGRKLFESSFEVFKERGYVHDLELEVVRKDGTLINVLLSATAIYGTDGRFLMSRSTMFDITVRKHAEEGLRLHSAIVSHMEEGVFLVRASDGVIVYANPKFEQMFGYAPAELIGRHVSAINDNSAPSREKTASLVIETLIEGNTWEGEVLNVKKDGTPFWCHASVSTFEHHAHGTVWISIHQDIMARKLAQDGLNESERRFRFLAENATDMLYRMSLPAGHYEYVSPASLAMFGYTPEEFYASPALIRAIIHPAWHGYFEEQWAKLIDGDMPPTYEYQVVHRRGDTRWMNQRNTLIRDDDGKPVAIQAIVTDVTERKLAERRLFESEARFRAMADNAPIIIWMANAGGEQAYTGCGFFNERWHDFTGLALEESQGYNWLSIVHAGDRERCLDAYIKAFEEAREFRLEYRMRRKDGVYRWMRDSGVPRFSAEREFVGFIGTCVDITDQKLLDELRAEIEHVGRLNIAGEMASGLAHELSQPLTAASNYLDGCLHRMRDAEWDREKLQKAVMLAYRQTERAGGIINHLKELIRKQGHERAMTDINDVIRDSVDFLEHDLSRQSIRVIPEFSDLPQIRVNKIEIEQVLLNLMKNAIESMASLPRRELRLATRLVESGNILVSVGDTGKGMPAAELDQVFYPFQSSKKDGLGLGLAICRSLVENYGGRIWAEQNGDAGMEFSFTLPTESMYE